MEARIYTRARAWYDILILNARLEQDRQTHRERKEEKTDQVSSGEDLKMGRGVLEVHLVDAKGLFGNDFLGKIDPYVIVQYRSQERKSSVARDQGRNPCWNDVFKFQINSSAENAQHKLFFRIMDHDNFSSDDFLGEATVNVTDLISLGVERGTWQLNATKYSVVLADKTYHGEIRVGFTFTATKAEEDGGEVGGWRHSFRQ